METAATEHRMNVIGVPITALPASEQISQMVAWASGRESKIVCVANVHMVIEAHSDPGFHEVLRRSDLVTPDGMPLVWMLRWLGARGQDRLPGLDIFFGVAGEAERRGIGVFLYGSTPDVLDRIKVRLSQDYPRLRIAGAISPPFRDLSAEERHDVVEQINRSGAGVVFVALGCPKQERWMFDHRGMVSAVMIGVGGAFPVYAGLQKRAPEWARRLGLEWLYRLLQEPRRLWRRYWSTNLPFLALAAKQVLKGRRTP